MAGMLPGVECARRRRFHNNTLGGSISSPTMHTHNSTRHSFSLYYPSNFESLMLSPSSMVQERSMLNLNHAYPDDSLRGPAREAKRKLDEKFRAHWKLESPKRKGLFRGLWRLQLRP